MYGTVAYRVEWTDLASVGEINMGHTTSQVVELVRDLVSHMTEKQLTIIANTLDMEKKRRKKESLALAPSFDKDEISLIRTGYKVKAVQRYRHRTGVSLDDAMDQLKYFLGEI